MRPIGVFSDKEQPPMEIVKRNTKVFYTPEKYRPNFINSEPMFSIAQKTIPIKPSVLPPTATPLSPPKPPSVLREGRIQKEANPKKHIELLRRVFKPLLNASYIPIAEAELIGLQYGYTFDHKLSTENTYVYVNPDGIPLIVHRGSFTASDWLIEDAIILTGLNSLMTSPRLKQARQITEMAERKYNKPADAFGHSLGGKIAEESGARGTIMTYNKATGIMDARKKINSRQVDYRNKKDIVSLLSEAQPRDTNMKYIKTAGIINSHSVDSLPTIAEERRT
jgi:hypothetical protein